MVARTILVLLVVAGLLPLAGWTGHPFDMHVWFETGRLLIAGANIYEPRDHYGYPPAWAYWAALTYYFYELSGRDFVFWRIIVKLPQAVALVVLALLLDRMTTRDSGGRPSWRLEAPYWAYAAYITLVWGQINALTALSLLLSLHLLERGRPYGSALSLGMGIAIKLYPLVSLPYFLGWAARSHGRGFILRYAALALLPTVLSTGITFLAFGWSPDPFLSTLLYQPLSLLCEACPGPRPLMNGWSFVWLLDPSLARGLPSQALWLAALLTVYYFLRSGGVAPLGALYLGFIATFPRVSEQSLLDAMPILMVAHLRREGSGLLKFSLISLPLLALAFTHLNFGLTHLMPLFEGEGSGWVEVLYRSRMEVISMAMGIIGLAVTVISTALITELIMGAGKRRPSLKTHQATGES